MAKRIATRVNGHTVTAHNVFGDWIVEIDTEIHVMKRDPEFRSEYISGDPVGPMTAAMSDILGYSEIVGWRPVS